jgi:hypothetical protein
MNVAVWIALFLIVDAVIVYFVIKHTLEKRRESGIERVDFRKLADFTKEIHRETGRYLEANYSGDPGQLPQALSGVLTVARTRAEERGLALDADSLRKLVEVSAVKHRVAKADQIRTALERAA